MAASLSVRGQRQDSTYLKKHVKQTDVQMLFSYYTQDNNHSAVTGGEGTEDMQVYASQMVIDTKKDSVKGFHFDVGLDVISSASTDNIDFAMSSASKVDARTHANIGISRVLKGSGIEAGVNSGFSIESDYLSWSAGFSASKLSIDQSREVSLAFEAFFDDLRWGRFDNGKPQELVYPEELRYREWFDIYRRNSYNLDLGIYQTVNKRMALAFYTGLSYQSGLLSTPFHRVYFSDNSKRVENLPMHRLKIPVAVQLNAFVGSYSVLRFYYRFYWDDFGIDAHTASLELPVKITPIVTVIPFTRFYSQGKSDYFNILGAHDPAQEFYTSDYDLSGFKSYKSGMGVRYAPFLKRNRRTFKAAELRYAFYKRSDGLTANMITLFFDFDFVKQFEMK